MWGAPRHRGSGESKTSIRIATKQVPEPLVGVDAWINALDEFDDAAGGAIAFLGTKKVLPLFGFIFVREESYLLGVLSFNTTTLSNKKIEHT